MKRLLLLAAAVLAQASAQTYQSCTDIGSGVDFACPDDTKLVTEYPYGAAYGQYATCGAFGTSNYACTVAQCCTPNKCIQFPDTTPACTANCAKNGLLDTQNIGGPNVPQQADNSEIYSLGVAQNAKYYSGFDWTNCIGLSSGDTCTPACRSSVTVTSATGNSFVLACDANGFIGYRDTIGSRATAWDGANGASSKNPHGAVVHRTKFGYWINFGDYPYTDVVHGGINTNASPKANALQCYLSICDATSNTVTNNLVSNAGANVDYTPCEGGSKTTGDTCQPTCGSGYTKTYSDGASSAKVINLACNSGNGAFDGTTNVQCIPNVCVAASVTFSTGTASNRVYTSCNALTSGATCVPTCPTGFTGNSAATGFKLDCDSAGAFNGALEPSLLSCEVNKCEKVLASTKRPGINYDECEFMGSGNNYFTTGRLCAPHCDQILGYTTNIPPDVEATVRGSGYRGSGYHVNDLIFIEVSGEDKLGVPPVILKVQTLHSSSTNAHGVLEGPIGTVTVITPAHFYRGIVATGTDNAEVLTTVANANGASSLKQPLSDVKIGLIRLKGGLPTSAYQSTTTPVTTVGQDSSRAAQFTITVRRIIIVAGGTNYAVNDILAIPDGQLGGGGAVELLVTVATVSSGGVVTHVALNSLDAATARPLRKPGYYTNIVPVNKAVGGSPSGLQVSVIVPPTTKMSCSTPAATPTAANTFDFDGTISAATTCASNVCDKLPLPTQSDHLDWTSCVGKFSGQTCTPVCKGGYSTTHTGSVMTLTCPNGWIDQTLWTDATTCSSGTCNTAAITNAIPGVDYSSCNGQNTGTTCTPSCPTGSTLSVTGSPFTLSCGVNGAFSATQATSTSCSLHRCTAINPDTPLTGADYTNCHNRYTGETCTPTCKEGYGTPTGASSFKLQCDADGTWSGTAGTTTCVAHPCAGGVTPASKLVGVNYDVCKTQSTGTFCTYACDGGSGVYYNVLSPAIQTFPLVCNAASQTFVDPAPPSSTMCVGRVCTGGASNAASAANADFSSCNTLTSGKMCSPTCNVGYRLAASLAPFQLQCIAGSGSTANTFTNPNANYPVCQANVCSGTITGNSGLDYSSCQSQLSGLTCTPTCPAGYTCGGTPSGFVLVCDVNRAFTDSVNNAISVTANRCKAVNPASAIANVNYGQCTISTSYSGSYCTPVCVSGYSTTTAATTYKQVCDVTTGFFVGTNSIVCKVLAGQTCAGLGWTNIVSGVCGETDTKLGPGQTEVLHMSKTYAQAYAVCDVAGVRLCTQGEIDQGSAKNTGSPANQASLGNSYVWTSTACNGGTSHIVSHNQATGAFTCASDASSYAVQCCTWQTATPHSSTPSSSSSSSSSSIVSPSTQSTKNCATLGWTKIVNGVCAESDQGFNGGSNACYTTNVNSAKSVCTTIGARLCTTAEINTKVSTGTGCNFDLSYVWTADTCTIRAQSVQRAVGYVTAKGDGSGYTECLTATDNRPTRCCADVTVTSSTNSRRTCNALGWTKIVSDVCGESDTGLGGCNAGKTYIQAAAICSTAGARLCSVGEVDSKVTLGTGCNFDTKWIWTSDSCGSNMYWIARGSGNGERKCKPATKKKNVRCCSDISMSTTKAPVLAPAPVPAPPRKNCASLGWTRIISNVCGASTFTNKCYNFRTQASAAEICSQLGARLCTATEIASTVTATTGCNFDSKYVWTSTACSAGFLTALGSGSGSLTSCVTATTQAPVRCCSDVTV